MGPDGDLKKILWKCRRGTKELDLILSRFVSSHYSALDEKEISQLKEMLEVEDPILTEWLCYGELPVDQGLESIVKKILSTTLD